jgi:hypothetical protein
MSDSTRPQQSSFSVTCPKGHTTIFDKYELCNRDDTMLRGDSGKRLPMEELYLRCRTCGTEMSVEIDCGGYRYQ